MSTLPTTPDGRASLAAATIGGGLMAGLLYAFQVSVVRGLAEVDDATYVSTFRSINRRILNPWFLAVYFGTTPLIAAAWLRQRRSGSSSSLIGTGLALNVAVLAVTMAGNVPLNEALARAATGDPSDTAAARARFEEPWNRLHTLRTVLGVASFIALVGARRPVGRTAPD